MMPRRPRNSPCGSGPSMSSPALRHSAASNLVNAGQSLYVVAKVLGHSQTRTTERYAHLDSKVLLNAVNAAAQVTGTNWSDIPA